MPPQQTYLGWEMLHQLELAERQEDFFFFFLTILSSLFFFPPLEESSCSYPQQEWQETAEKGNTEIAVVIPCPHGRLATETKVSGSVAVGPNACRG